MIAIEYSKRLLGWVGRVILKIREALPPPASVIGNSVKEHSIEIL